MGEGRLRVQNGLTQEHMLGMAGIARSHLVALENGEKKAKLDTVWRIAEALDIMPSDHRAVAVCFIPPFRLPVRTAEPHIGWKTRWYEWC